MSKELIYKICLFGDRNVGKTSLTQAGIQKNIKSLNTSNAPLKLEKMSIRFLNF
jgi:hypothetical protein